MGVQEQYRGAIGRERVRLSFLSSQAEVGSGLGISIVRRIAQLHGLTVEFGDRSAGRGMRVVLTRI